MTMGALSVVRPSPEATTYFSNGAARLSALWRAVMRSECPDHITQLFASLIEPWGHSPIPNAPQWPSDIAEDHSPFEFSVAIGGANPELRILVEAQASDPTVQAYWEAGRALTERIAREHGADVSRLKLVEDLFRPTDPHAVFAVWHAVCLYAQKKPGWKIYLNPQGQGKANTKSIVKEALARLGYERAWPTIERMAMQRGPELDEIKYFSLDAVSGPVARLKIYFRHHEASAADLERIFASSTSYVPGDVTAFCRAMAKEEGPFTAKPIGSCFAFVDGDGAAPSAGTLYMPVDHYAPSDAAVKKRVTEYLSTNGMDVDAYERPLRAFAGRPLEKGVGMHSYAAFRREPVGPRVTIYFAPEVFHVESPVVDSAVRFRRPKAITSAEELVERFEGESIADHPFYARLGREPVDLRKVYLLLVNARIGIVQDFSRRLSLVVAKVDDERLRSLLAKQLNDELGNGDFTRAHRLLFDGLVEGVSPWRPDVLDDAMLAPGRALSARLEAIYQHPDPYVGMGAVMVAEVYGKQVDLRLGEELRRQKAVDPTSLTWLSLHEELELEHVDEARAMARCVPRSALASARRGAEAVRAASWAFFDDIYRLCFR